MKPIKNDLYYLQLIAKKKSEIKFKCKSCKHSKEGYWLTKKYGRKCKYCKSVESVTSKTAFSGIRVSISRIINILFELQQNYMDWLDTYESDVSFYLSKKTNFKGFRARLSESYMSKKIMIRTESVWFY